MQNSCAGGVPAPVFPSGGRLPGGVRADRAKPLRKSYAAHFAAGCSKALSCVEVCPMGIRKSYAAHFAAGCSKALSCVEVCPMGIDTLASMARMNRLEK